MFKIDNFQTKNLDSKPKIPVFFRVVKGIQVKNCIECLKNNAKICHLVLIFVEKNKEFGRRTQVLCSKIQNVSCHAEKRHEGRAYTGILKILPKHQ